MKKIIFITIIFLFSNQTFSQNKDSLQLRYQFLDSTRQKIIILKNPNSISNKERELIYHYAEYFVGKDQRIQGDIKFYYAAGKEPFYWKADRDYRTNKAGRINFKRPEDRFGILRSFGGITSVSLDNFDLNNLKLNGIWEKFYPDGSSISKYEYENGKPVDGVKKENYKNGITILITFKEGYKVRSVTTRKNTLVKSELTKSLVSYVNDKFIFTYTKGKIDDGYHYVYDLDTGKKNKRLEYKLGEYIKSVDLDNDGYEVLNKFDENSVRTYFDSKENINQFEGIYRYSNPQVSSQYKFAIIKSGYNYKGHLIEANCVGCQGWRRGDIKFVMTEGAVNNLFDVSWKFPKGENRRDNKFIFIGEHNGGLLKSDNLSLIKLYPKLNVKKQVKNKSGEWLGNGSGLIISKSGYIVTNHHVIDDAVDIEVEFILDDEVQKFNAEIVQIDKVNDLAVIKIVDVNFDGVKELPYNFKTRSSDVGTKVYAFGYPLALSIMGKEIKVTDGIISSKTGYDGDITTYQISAAIQGGNSGGPLFDDKGNFIGINSSGINKQLADNVGYSIKTSYVLNLIDVLPKTIDLPSNTKLQSLPLTEQIKQISKYVVLVKVK